MERMKEELEKRKEKIDQEIAEIFEDKVDHSLWKSMSYYPESGGKKLRPFLAMVSTAVFDEPEEKAIPYGVALELVHNFTLVHDDLMDQDEMRRGNPTLHQKIGDAHAINAGDGLFALAFNLLSKTKVEGEKIRELLDELSSSVIKIAEGQEEDLSFEEDFDIKENDFIQMIEKKTAYLFRAATRGGAIIAGSDEEEIDKMGEYARKMGIAFQLQDDYLDLVGDEGKIGKDVGSDIKEGKRTLMVIKALSELSGEDAERLMDILQKNDNPDPEIDEAIGLLEKAGAIEYSKELAETYGEKAKNELEDLPDNENKKILEELVDFVITRDR